MTTACDVCQATVCTATTEVHILTAYRVRSSGRQQLGTVTTNITMTTAALHVFRFVTSLHQAEPFIYLIL